MMAIYAAEAPPVLTVPMGTANLVAQYLGVPRSLVDVGLETLRSVAETSRTLRRMFPPKRRLLQRIAERVLRSLERHEIMRIDAGLANGQLFLIMAGVGFDAHIVHELARRRTGPISLASYAVPAATAVARYGFPVVCVEVEGRRVFERQGVVMIANLPQYGTGFPIVPGASPTDGKLDVVCLPCDSRVRLLELLVLAADGRHLTIDGVFRATARTLRISADREVPVQIDGDPGGSLPLSVSLAAHQVALIRPVLASPSADDRARSVAGS
jgi:diacylglycerol kinase family enzyme